MNANIGNDENELHTPDVVPDFPTLTLEEVQNNITLGTYQIKQAAHYTDEHLHNEGGFTIYLHRSAEDLIRVRIQSRHRNSTKYFDGHEKRYKGGIHSKNPMARWLGGEVGFIRGSRELLCQFLEYHLALFAGDDLLG